jgi:membrane protein YdbS with pleckstrin-like domain
MIRWMQNLIVDLMKVPGEPQPPDGSAGSARVFRSGPNYYRWRVALWFLASLGALIPIIGVFVILTGAIRTGPPGVRLIAEVLRALLGTAFLASAFFTLLQQRMNYELRWYMVTDRCLRVRSGIMRVHEITTTFANIQEVRLSAGPLQKLLGLADVEVHSAGGGSGPGSSGSHVARFEGVDNASEIRDFILARLRQYRDSGLGERDHFSPAAFGDGDQAAAQAILTEARALHAALVER